MSAAVRAWVCGTALVLGAGPAAAQWSITMRAMQNPLPVGQCTAIEIIVLGANGGGPVRPDGKQVSGWDFDLELAAATADAFAWGDERHRFLCARAPTSPSALIVASYPARHLTPAEIVPGVFQQQSIEVMMAADPPPVAAPSPPSGAQVQGVGRALGAGQDPRDPEDVAAALASGRAVLRGLRFTDGTALLEPSSGPLISQIAGALARTPGQFLIEAHVDGTPSPATQALSEQRAAAIKAALVAAGSSPMQLAAVGYGASRPLPGARRSARVEIARTH